MRNETKCPRFTDQQWGAFEKWLPRGNRAADTRGTTEAMLYTVRTGLPWAYLPVDLGSPDAVTKTWERWCKKGTMRRAFHGLFPDSRRNLAAVAIDGKYIPASLDAHGARGSRGTHSCPDPVKGCIGVPPDFCTTNQALGKQIYYGTLLTAMCDADAEIINWQIMPANFMESRATPVLLHSLSRSPGSVIADGRHNTTKIHAQIDGMGSTDCIPGKGIAKDEVLWRLRNTIERAFSPLLCFRRVALRSDKTAAAYDETIALAAIYVGLGRRYPAL